MDIKAKSTKELDAILLDLLRAEHPDADLIREIGTELKLRTPEPTSEELAAAQAHYDRIYGSKA